MEFEPLSKTILDCAYEVHTLLGPGLLESAYEECLVFELTKRNLKVERQKPLPVVYKNIKLEFGYRIDILVENSILIELKTVDAIIPVHVAQILTYMKFSETKTGFLINFNVKHLKEGIKRFVL
ncbi:MAG: GxxExxY protein [Ignavibacteriae bacterium]|nr:GxxExxY protein [Ignavibacteriota bacterium]